MEALHKPLRSQVSTPNSFYNLVLYNAADQAAAGRITLFTVNGNTQTSTWNASSSTLLAGTDYVEFNPAVSDASGNMVITWTGTGSAEGDINGFQLQSVPPMGPLVTTTNPTNKQRHKRHVLRRGVNPVGEAATCYFLNMEAPRITAASAPPTRSRPRMPS